MARFSGGSNLVSARPGRLWRRAKLGGNVAWRIRDNVDGVRPGPARLDQRSWEKTRSGRLFVFAARPVVDVAAT